MNRQESVQKRFVEKQTNYIELINSYGFWLNEQAFTCFSLKSRHVKFSVFSFSYPFTIHYYRSTTNLIQTLPRKSRWKKISLLYCNDICCRRIQNLVDLCCVVTIIELDIIYQLTTFASHQLARICMKLSCLTWYTYMVIANRLR